MALEISRKWQVIFLFLERGEVGCTIYSFIMAALMLCYHSIAPYTCKDDISGSGICHFLSLFLVSYIDRSK